MHILGFQTIYRDDLVSIGLSRYPTTSGHTIATFEQQHNLFNLAEDDFVRLFTVLSRTAGALRKYYKVKRCALVTEGDRSLSLLPLHGLNQDWEPVTSDMKEFHDTFPGYVSSKDGPPKDHDRLNTLCDTIQEISQIRKPYNNQFQGSHEDKNLFARIIWGELLQYRVWEDDDHVASLTPFPNTPGFTVLVPRKRLVSDIFAIDKKPLSALMVAAHKVAAILKQAFKVERCGMIFEGFEIDHAHVKLIPIQQSASETGNFTDDAPKMVMPFTKRYEGFASSLDGPLTKHLESVLYDSNTIRETLLPSKPLSPPNSWVAPSQHLSSVLHDLYYRQLFAL
ncbi:hypothetical protein IAQ61_010841 [Plenodomus lingam]|nr:hypothetical protein IAQ61_010841 [Plenodomus lingam]